MSDFTQLPVKDGFKGCFDYTNYNGGDTWLNQYAGGSGIDFNMSNAVKSDGCILFPEALGLGYLIDNIGNNFTLYSIFKCDYSHSAYTANYYVWLMSALGANANYRMYLYQVDLRTFGFMNVSKATDVSSINFYDYCVAAISVCNGQQKVYVNGELIYTGTKTINYSIDEIGVNLNASGYGGAVPTISQYNTANVYVKYIGYATNNHNEIQIQENSNWLLEQYGLKLPDKDSRLAGTDALAIAYAIARNQESAAALQDMKKAYQQGMLNGNGDTTPDYENDDPTPPGLAPIIDENDPEKSDNTAVAGDDGVVDMENGLWHIYTDNNGNITGYVNLYFDGYVYKGYSSDGVLTHYKRNFLHCDAYDASGNLVYKSPYSNQTSGTGAFSYSYVFDGEKITEEYVLQKYYLRGTSAFVDMCWISYTSIATGKNYYTSELFSFGKYISGSYSKCTNRKPF